jgi:hypothetical protein
VLDLPIKKTLIGMRRQRARSHMVPYVVGFSTAAQDGSVRGRRLASFESNLDLSNIKMIRCLVYQLLEDLKRLEHRKPSENSENHHVLSLGK